MKIFVAGAGTMGAGIAWVAAAAGIGVYLYDVKAELVKKGIDSIARGLERQKEKGNLTAAECEKIYVNISGTADIADVAGCGFAIEAVTENLDIKKELFIKLEEAAKPDIVFATNTSSLSVSSIAGALKRPENIGGMHFFNPAQVMKLVEISGGDRTSPETLAKLRELAVLIGKEPVDVSESPGFIVNRLLIPMINEAALLFSEGVASAKDIDKAMLLGANHPVGPLALADMIGIDVILDIMESLERETGDPKYRPAAILRKMTLSGMLGRKTGKGFHEYGR